MAHKLLLADDSVTIQRVIELTFADQDVQVVAVGDGKQAIERIQADPPDIVLADVDMPERDGFQVASFVKQDAALNHIPVLLLTGAFEPVDEARVRAAGCDGVLVKPFEPQLVIARVRDLLARQPGDAAATPIDAAARFEQSPLQVPAAASPAADEALQDLTLTANEPVQPGVALDDYFDRLDAALTNRVVAQQAPLPAPETWAAPADNWPEPSVPLTDAGFDANAAAAGQVGVPPEETPGGAVPAAGQSPDIAEAFDWLLATEQGEATPPTPPGSASTVAPTPTPESRSAAIEAIADDVTRRVMERLADRALREQVADIVSGVAERLVREEIERLKSLAK